MNQEPLARLSLLAAKAISQIEQGTSLNHIEHLNSLNDKDMALYKMLVYGVLRQAPELLAIYDSLVKKPLKPKHRNIKWLICIGIFQLKQTHFKAHTIINEIVEAVKQQAPYLAGLANASLRQWVRTPAEILHTLPEFAMAKHPRWLFDQIKNDWPSHASHIFQANNCASPMIIRVNSMHCNRNDYSALLTQHKIKHQLIEHLPEAIALEQPSAVNHLPNFESGWVSVQDTAAQAAVELLPVPKSGRLLDACCAPGGKLSHLINRYPHVNVMGTDISQERLDRVKTDSKRLGIKPTLKAANIHKPSEWFDGHLFDAILLDGPCSGTGVISRNPDIKLLRRPSDIQKFSTQLLKLLNDLWPLLKPGGHLLYATCSIMPLENDHVIQAFLTQSHDALCQDIEHPLANRTQYGIQFIPKPDGPNGLFYALLKKNRNN